MEEKKRRKYYKMNNLKEIDEFIQAWEIKAMLFYKNEIRELKKEFKEFNERDSEKYGHKWVRERDKEYGEFLAYINETYTKTAIGLRWNSIEDADRIIDEKVRCEAERKEKQLISRVNSCVGEIVEPIALKVGANGDLNGWIRGNDGICKIQTIYAGGHNHDIIVNTKKKQCLHFRVLVRKLKNN